VTFTPDTVVLGGLLAAVVVLQLAALLRGHATREDLRRLEGLLREEFARIREAAAAEARAGRDETARALRDLGEASAAGVGRLGEAHRDQLRLFSERLDALTRSLSEGAALQRTELAASQTRLAEVVKAQLENIRAAVSGELEKVRGENAAKLEEMRRTVDEKLHDTLEKRLGESFDLVSRRLEDVSKGLGEMQQLATGVGDLKNVLTNVKSRGTWGEFQLGALLAETLAPDQYAANVKTNPRSAELVEFAVRLPGRGGEDGPVWLPIDAKFPKEDYERLQAAADRADKEAAEAALRGLERRLKESAKDIRDKYLCPPYTTDFGILFLPTEGLYAEVLRRPGLVDELQRAWRVSVAGPTTLTALLNSLQMGFRTLAIEKRSSEVWRVLGAVKSEFLKFGEVFERVQRKIEDADKILKSAEVRTRAMNRKLRAVEALSETEASRQLELASDAAEADDEETV